MIADGTADPDLIIVTHLIASGWWIFGAFLILAVILLVWAGVDKIGFQRSGLWVEVQSFHPFLMGALLLPGVFVLIALLLDSELLIELATADKVAPETVIKLLVALTAAILGVAFGLFYGHNVKVYEERRKQRYVAWLLLGLRTTIADDAEWIKQARDRIIKDTFAFPSSHLRKVITLAHQFRPDTQQHAAELEEELRILSLHLAPQRSAHPGRGGLRQDPSLPGDSASGIVARSSEPTPTIPPGEPDVVKRLHLIITRGLPVVLIIAVVVFAFGGVRRR